MAEVGAAVRFIVAQLKTRLALQAVTRAPAPAPRASGKGVVWQLSANGQDSNTHNGDRLFSTQFWQVCAYADGDTVAEAQALAGEIDMALHQQAGTNPDGAVVQCVRVRPVYLAEKIDGRTRQVVGGIYELTVREA